MWDEKKFFEDYRKEADKIQPDKKFVEDTVKMISKESSKGTIVTFPYRFVAIVASVMLVVACIGIWAVHNNIKKNDESKVAHEQEIFTKGLNAAANNGTDTEDSNTADDENASVGQMAVTDSTIAEIVQMIDDSEVIVSDEEGNPLDDDQRAELKSSLIVEEKVSDMPEYGSKTTYKLIGDYMITLHITDDNYLVVDKESEQTIYRLK
ncbi:MAG: hypothetical protein K6G88_03195 [Lachnospiraceae bacterium]|nr:hypothetical protein [Lachnospiraceae bacterium]